MGKTKKKIVAASSVVVSVVAVYWFALRPRRKSKNS
jgi:hypothetical protein